MPAKGTRRTVWFNSREWPLVESYLKANDLPLSRLVRRLVLDHILEESEGDDAALLKELVAQNAQNETNILRPETQIKLLRSVLHSQILLGEVLAGFFGGSGKSASDL